jgi:formylglycine-generating enzyme required for sulfatase activity
MKKLFFIVTFLLCCGFTYGSEASLGILDSVFQQQRTDLEDVIYLRNNDVLRGEVLNDQFSVIAQFGVAQPIQGESDGAGFSAGFGGGETVTVTLPGNVNMLFRRIPAGEFVMGSPSDEKYREKYRHDSEGPLHKVTISKPFYMGVYEVTQEQWGAIMGSNPSKFQKSMNHPVESVSWNDCQGYIAKLNKLNLGTFRLPTEAEWEYACRAGTTTRYYWGDDPNDFEIGEYAWYSMNSDKQTNEVGQKKPNAWGLYDMSGNVWEWCWDWYGGYDAGSVVDPLGRQTGSSRVKRGGSWDFHAESCRSADRYGYNPDTTTNDLGFRLVLSRTH